MNPYKPPLRGEEPEKPPSNGSTTEMLVYAAILLFVFAVLVPIMLVVYPRYY